MNVRIDYNFCGLKNDLKQKKKSYCYLLYIVRENEGCGRMSRVWKIKVFLVL